MSKERLIIGKTCWPIKSNLRTCWIRSRNRADSWTRDKFRELIDSSWLMSWPTITYRRIDWKKTTSNISTEYCNQAHDSTRWCRAFILSWWRLGAVRTPGGVNRQLGLLVLPRIIWSPLFCSAFWFAPHSLRIYCLFLIRLALFWSRTVSPSGRQGAMVAFRPAAPTIEPKQLGPDWKRRASWSHDQSGPSISRFLVLLDYFFPLFLPLFLLYISDFLLFSFGASTENQEKK